MTQSKRFPRALCLVMAGTIVVLLLLAHHIISHHQPISVSELFSNHDHSGSPNQYGDSSHDALYTNVRLACLIPTSTPRLYPRAATVRNTWGRRCNRIFFFSDRNDTSFPTIALPGVNGEGMHMLTTKVRAALSWVYDHHMDDADWFLKADDDTYVIVENLRYLLRQYDPLRPLYLGHHLQRYLPDGYMSGGAGYVLSRAALEALVTRGYRQGAGSSTKTPSCRRWGGAEDVALAQCLHLVGVRIVSSLDGDKRQTFHPFNLLSHLTGNYPTWYYQYTKYKVKQGAECCSTYSISYHFVEPNMMLLMDHLLYRTKVYGHHKLQQPQQDSRPKLLLPAGHSQTQSDMSRQQQPTMYTTNTGT